MKHRDRSATTSGHVMGASDEDAIAGAFSNVHEVAPLSASAETDPRSQEDPLARKLTPGTIINSKYRVESTLGQGAMGIVVACEHIELHERVALKFLRKVGISQNDDFNARFLREAQVCAKLKNQHITRVVDVGTWGDDSVFMVMEYLDGCDLRHIMRQTGRMPVAQAINYGVQLCEGLAEAHALGIVHRDLKPSNVFVVRNVDGSDLVKILDFGISKLTSPDRQSLGDGEITETGLVLGSPKYMSPEQLFEANAVGPHSDVWALGVMLYEMLTGRLPVEGSNLSHAIAWLSSDKPPASLRQELPEVTTELEAAILRCLARETSTRTRSVDVLAGDLLDAVGAMTADSVVERLGSILNGPARDGARGSTPGTRDDSLVRSGRAPRTSATRRRRRARWSLVAIAAAVFLVSGLGIFVARQGRPSPVAIQNPVATAEGRTQPPSVHVSIDATPREARVQVDGADLEPGRSSFDVPPGTRDHVIRVSAPGYTPEERHMQLATDLQLEISLERIPLAPSVPSTPAALLPLPQSPRLRNAGARPAAAPSASSKGSSCEAPYYFSNGIKTFKPECL